MSLAPILLLLMFQTDNSVFSMGNDSFVVRRADKAVGLLPKSHIDFTLDGHVRIEQNDQGVVLVSDHMDGVASQLPDKSYDLASGNAIGNVDFVLDSAAADKFNKTPPPPDKLADRLEVKSDKAILASSGGLKSITLPDPFESTEHRTGVGKKDGVPYVADTTLTASSGTFAYLPAVKAKPATKTAAAQREIPAKLQTGGFKGPVHIHTVRTLRPADGPPVVSSYDITCDLVTFDLTKSPGEVVLSGNVLWKTDGEYVAHGSSDSITFHLDDEQNLLDSTAVGNPGASHIIPPAQKSGGKG